MQKRCYIWKQQILTSETLQSTNVWHFLFCRLTFSSKILDTMSFFLYSVQLLQCSQWDSLLHLWGKMKTEGRSELSMLSNNMQTKIQNSWWKFDFHHVQCSTICWQINWHDWKHKVSGGNEKARVIYENVIFSAHRLCDNNEKHISENSWCSYMQWLSIFSFPTGDASLSTGRLEMFVCDGRKHTWVGEQDNWNRGSILPEYREVLKNSTVQRRHKRKERLHFL